LEGGLDEERKCWKKRKASLNSERARRWAEHRSDPEVGCEVFAVDVRDFESVMDHTKYGVRRGLAF
jgi:hypothetical protein